MRPSLARRLALVAVACLCAGPAGAADNTWSNGAGTLLWTTSAANWTSPAVWNNNFSAADGAVFGATGVGTVNLSGVLNVRSLNFTATGYTLAGGTLTLSPFGTSTLGAGAAGVGGATSSLTATTATINSALTSAFGLDKQGDGVLALGAGAGTGLTGFQPVPGSGVGATALVGTGTDTTFGGSLRLLSGTSLPPTASVALGNGFLDLQANVALAGLVFTSNAAPSAITPINQGVVGTGTLTTQLVRVLGAGSGLGNTSACRWPTAAGRSGLRSAARAT